MIGWVLSRIAEAYYAPRRSARRILDARLSVGPILALWFLSVLVHRLFILLAMALDPHWREVMIEEDLLWRVTLIGEDSLSKILTGLSLHFIIFLSVGLAYLLIGRLFGGKGDARAIFSVSVWFSFAVTWLMAPLSVAITLLFEKDPVADLVASLLFIVLCTWIFSPFLTEAHEFRRVGVVFATTLGIIILLWILFMTVVFLFSFLFHFFG